MKHVGRTFASITLSLLLGVAARAEVIAVEQIEKGLMISSEPSMSMYWQGKSSKALLIFIPGGEGYIGLKPGQTDQLYQFHQMLKRLTNPTLTSGRSASR